MPGLLDDSEHIDSYVCRITTIDIVIKSALAGSCVYIASDKCPALKQGEAIGVRPLC